MVDLKIWMEQRVRSKQSDMVSETKLQVRTVAHQLVLYCGLTSDFTHNTGTKLQNVLLQNVLGTGPWGFSMHFILSRCCGYLG